MGIGLIGKAAGDQQTHRLTNQSPAVLMCVDMLRDLLIQFRQMLSYKTTVEPLLKRPHPEMGLY